MQMVDLIPELHWPFADFIQMEPWNGGPPNSLRKLGWMSRGHFKSSITTVGNSLRKLCIDRNTTVGIVSAKQENTQQWLIDIRNTVDFNPFFRWAFPEIRSGGKWSETSITVTRDREFGTNVAPSIRAYTINGGLASAHHPNIILDDPLNEQTAFSESERERAIGLYVHLESIIAKYSESVFTVVGTPWPGYDVIQHAMEHECQQGDRLYWGIGARGGFKMSPELYDTHPELIPPVEDRLERDRVIFHEVCPDRKLQKIKRQDLNQYIYQYLPVTGSTLVTMTDFTQKPIKDIREGDLVLGFDTRKQRGAKLSSTIVQKVHFQSNADIVDVTTSSGDVLHCTADHRWLTKQSSKNKRIYGPAQEGWFLQRAHGRQYGSPVDWAWLAGFLDGEGCFKTSSTISVSQNPGATANQFLSVVERLGLKVSSQENNKKNTCLVWYFSPSVQFILDLLANASFGKRDQAVAWMGKKARNFLSHQIVSIVPAGKQDVYCLETESGNFIADGYLTGNCTRPEDEDNGFDIKLIRDFALFMDGRIHCDCHPNHGHHLSSLQSVAICDPALTEDRRGCESAIVVVGRDPKCGCRFMLYENGWRVLPDALVDVMCDVAREWPTIKIFAIEDVQFQATFKPWLIERQSQGKFPLGVRIEGVKPKKRDKDLRIAGQQAYVANGHWHKRPDMYFDESRINWIWEVCKWPNQPKKRDRADVWAYSDDVWEMLGLTTELHAQSVIHPAVIRNRISAHKALNAMVKALGN